MRNRFNLMKHCIGVVTLCLVFIQVGLCAQKPLQVISTLDTANPEIAFSSDGRVIATTGMYPLDKDAGDMASGYSLRLWNTTNGKLLKKIYFSESLSNIVFSRNGKWLAVGVGQNVKIFQTQSWKLLQSIKNPANVTVVAFSPNSQLLALGRQDKRFSLIQTASWKQKVQSRISHNASSLSFNNTGKVLAVGSIDNSVSLFNTSNGSRIKMLNAPTKQTDSWGRVRFSPDGNMLAVWSKSPVVTFYETKNWQAQYWLTGSENGERVNDVDFVPNSKRVVIAASDSLRLSSLLPSEETIMYHSSTSQGSLASPISVTVAPTKKLFATVSWDSKVKIWKLP